MHRSKLMIAAAVAALAAFGGGAYAASQSNTNPRQAFLNDVAKRLGTSPQKLNQAFRSAFFDRLDAAVAAGRMSKAQADAIKRRIQQNGAIPFGAPGFFRHEHRGMLGGPGGRDGLLAAAAKYLGLTPTQLGSQLESGRSLAQVAKSRNKSTSGLQNAMLGAAKTRLDSAVKAKQLTSAQEAQLLSRLKSKVGNLINNSEPRGLARPRGGGFFGRPPGAADLGGGPPGAADFGGGPPGAAGFGGGPPPPDGPPGGAPAPGTNSSTPY